MRDHGVLRIDILRNPSFGLLDCGTEQEGGGD